MPPQAHLSTLESTDETRAALLVGLDYLLSISFVDDDEVFKIALDYWNFFVPDVYAAVTTGLADANAPFAFGGPANAPPAAAGRRALYAPVLSKLRLLMISRMAKPEEVRPWLYQWLTLILGSGCLCRVLCHSL